MILPNEEPERKTPFPGPNAPKTKEQYKFSQEELRALRECNSESFYQRCVPFGTFLGMATYYAVKTGILAPNNRFGAAPKVTAAVLAGFVLGKFSYQKKCAEKFMALPDSKIGQLMRARKAGVQDDKDSGEIPNIPISPFGGMTDTYTDIEPPSRSYDYDSRPNQEGLDDSFRPSMDNPIIMNDQELPPEQKHITTYDELRKKNREEYEQKRLASYRQAGLPKTPERQPPPPASSGSEFIDEYKPPSSQGKNQYGDVWG